jgi:DNA-binding response OmpR family regulator
MPRDIEKGLEAGFFCYLTKPIKVNLFMEALDAALKPSDPNPACRPKRKPHEDHPHDIRTPAS